MNKTEKKTVQKTKAQLSPLRRVNSRLFVWLLVLTLLVVGVTQFFSNGGSDYIKRVYYGHVVRQAYHKEFKNLDGALRDLGLSEDKDIKSVCGAETIATDGVNVSDVLFCGLQSDNYIEVSSSNKLTITKAARQLDELVKNSDGSISTNATPTFGQYFADLADGIDYYPDINATFVRGNYLCGVSVNVAYSKPKPPAYSIRFGCNSPRTTQDDIYLSPPES